MNRLSFLILALIPLYWISTSAEVPKKISFQGQVSSATGVWLTGPHVFTFRLYDDSTAVTELWSDTITLEVENGNFHAHLGENTPLPPSIFYSGQVLWLETKIDATTLPSRQPLVSVAHSFHAQRADTALFALNTLSTGDSCLWETDGTNIYRMSGAVGIQVNPPLAQLHVDQTIRTNRKFVAGGHSTGTNKAIGLNVIGGTNLGTWTDPINPNSKAAVLSGDDFLFFTTDWGDNNHFIIRSNMAGIGLGVDGSLNPIAPSVTLALRDADTGLDWISDGNFAIKTNGTERVRFASNGNVGIGTSNPIEKLQVAGIIYSTSGGIKFPDGTIQTTAAAGGGIGGNGTTNYIPKFTASTTIGNSAIYETGGKVGIGSTSPSQKLHVSGNMIANGYWGRTDGNYLDLRPGGGGWGLVVRRATDISDYINIEATNTYGTIGFVSGDGPLYFTSSKVGIGTSSPARKLDVSGLANISGSSTSDVLTVSNSSTGSGVNGETNANKSTKAGVVGKAKVSGGSGVYGTTSSLGISGGSSVAVYGWANGSGPSIGGAALGVLGRINSYQGSSASVPAGVFGWAEAISGINAGVWGQSESSAGYGVYGAATHASGSGNHGVVGRSDSPNGRGVYYSGGLAGSGPKSAVVKISKGPVLVYCQESPENWFEDFGEGQLVDGRVHIELDPFFLETVTVNERHAMKVFVQLNDDCSGVYVKRGFASFDVIELNKGTSNASFTYRVVAKRKGFEENRLDHYEPAMLDPYLYSEVKDRFMHRVEGGSK